MNKKTKEAIRKLEENIKEVQAQIEELKREDETPKFEYPNKGDKVWHISPDGKVNLWCWTDSDYEKALIHQGNIVSTKKEAEFEVERRKVIAELKLFKEPNNREWDDSTRHYFIYFNTATGRVEIDRLCLCKSSEIYFATQEDAQKAIDFVGIDRVKKYYLRIKE